MHCVMHCHYRILTTDTTSAIIIVLKALRSTEAAALCIFSISPDFYLFGFFRGCFAVVLCPPSAFEWEHLWRAHAIYHYHFGMLLLKFDVDVDAVQRRCCAFCRKMPPPFRHCNEHMAESYLHFTISSRPPLLVFEWIQDRIPFSVVICLSNFTRQKMQIIETTTKKETNEWSSSSVLFWWIVYNWNGNKDISLCSFGGIILMEIVPQIIIVNNRGDGRTASSIWR